MCQAAMQTHVSCRHDIPCKHVHAVLWWQNKSRAWRVLQQVGVMASLARVGMLCSQRVYASPLTTSRQRSRSSTCASDDQILVDKMQRFCGPRPLLKKGAKEALAGSRHDT